MAYLDFFDFWEAGRAFYFDLSVLELFATNLAGCRGWYRGYLVWRGRGRVKVHGEEEGCRLYETARLIAAYRVKGIMLSRGTAAIWLGGRRVEGKHERWVMKIDDQFLYDLLQRLIYELMKRHPPPRPRQRHPIDG